MLSASYGQLGQLKTTVNSSLGAVGVGVATTAEYITFVEGGLFKATVAILGLILVCITIYNVSLDVRIKRNQLEEDNRREK